MIRITRITMMFAEQSAACILDSLRESRHIMESVNTIPKSEIAISKTSEPTAQVLVLQPRNLAVKNVKEVR